MGPCPLGRLGHSVAARGALAAPSGRQPPCSESEDDSTLISSNRGRRGKPSTATSPSGRTHTEHWVPRLRDCGEGVQVKSPRLSWVHGGAFLGRGIAPESWGGQQQRGPSLSTCRRWGGPAQYLGGCSSRSW